MTGALGQSLRQHGAIPRISQKIDGLMRGHPMGRMTFLGRWSQPQRGLGQVDRADLFCPAVIFGHVAKPAEDTEPLRSGDAPAGLFHHLAVQRGQRVFARINAAPGKLELVIRFSLMGQQDVIATQQDGIDAGAAAVDLAALHRLAIASDHGCPLGAAVALTI